ncbi:DUF3168 domain-containing protein [Rhizobium lusitanum]|uniref:DUF3168 domain-containing protein n=1 Tax=Rhizobium lusitanum TaxID=293958 RepID=A0A6L9U6C3_9HYPH|nr:DUF3168 domain-containing protein [Rhizobium lusitanum]NEI70959.1 DUF3168 domain-containing protein [Rhizobium lusitanum]
MSSIIIANYLLARDASVKAIASNRIYPIQAPQGATRPYIVTNKVGSKDHGLVNAPGKYYRERLTVECITDEALTSIKLGDAVMGCLSGITKRSIADFIDVDIRFADVDFSDQNDTQTAFRDVKQFFIWWRAKG